MCVCVCVCKCVYVRVCSGRGVAEIVGGGGGNPI